MRCLLLIVSMLSIIGCKKINDFPGGGNDAPPLYRVSGTKILDALDEEMYLQGVAFGNEVWSDKEVPDTHHNEDDYIRVKEMGMNLIRFYLNYKTLEDDDNPYSYKSAGWDWIDRNIAWAKKNNIFLILNVHVPQGGFQSLGLGDALWTDPENQNRLVAMWTAIADRYKNEPQIVGYGLVNEPVPTNDISQWQQLAQRITDAIRTVDNQHILFIERAIYVKGKLENENYNFPVINDQNAVYEFHFYDPFEYTHQLFNWTGLGDGGKYPDETRITTSATKWYTAIFDNPNLSAGNSDWTYYEGVKYKVTDPKIALAIPALVGARVGGRVYFDQLEIKEYDQDNQFVRTVWQSELDDNIGWSYWSNNNSGSAGLSSSVGLNGSACLYIENANDDCNMSNFGAVFETRPGFSYQINGWMNGSQVAQDAACSFRIDFLTTDGPIQKRNKDYLDATLRKFADWGKEKNVPIYMGEFGAGIHCFENEKGGLTWVSDMLDVANKYNVHFSYHSYHEDNFGIYFGYGTLTDPTNANQPLIDLFKQKLR